MGKEVYDQSGKRIGEVKDVVLGSTANPQLASGLRNLSSGSAGSTGSTSTTRTDSGSTRTASGNVGGVGATGSIDATGSGIGASGSLGSTGSSGSGGSIGSGSMPSMMSMGGMSETAVVVSHGGFLGAGSNLIRVPLSQLNYDQSNRRITISVSESDLANLPEWSETSRSAAE